MKIIITSSVIASGGQLFVHALLRMAKRVFCGLHSAVLAAFFLVSASARAQDAYTLDNDTATVSGTLWTITGTNINIADAGAATLTIDTTGTLETTGTGFVGRNAGSSGTVTVGGVWTNEGPLFVGNAGAGTLVVETTGTVISRTATSKIGAIAGSTGTALVNGYWQVGNLSGTTFTGATVIVGGSGAGFLDVAATGTFLAGNVYLADFPGSSGTMHVRGYAQPATTIVGQSDIGVLQVFSGGTLNNTGNLRIGGNATGSGTVVVESGASVIGNGWNIGYTGTGYAHIKAGGTVALAATTLYVGGNSGTANRNSYGEVLIDGYYSSYNNYYSPIGYSGTGVMTVGPTGVVSTGAIELGREYTASGTLRVFGRYNVIGGVNTFTRIGYVGRGTLIVENGGYLSVTGSYLYVGSGISITSTSIGGLNGAQNAVGHGVLIVEEGGTFYRRASNDMIIGGLDAATAVNPSTVTTGTVIVRGLLDTDKFIRIGGAGASGTTTSQGSHGYLYIAPTGTLNSGGARLTYTDWRSTGYVGVDGVWNLSDYIIVAHYGNSLMKIGVTGTAISDNYVSIGQGDGHDKTGIVAPRPDYKTAISGSLSVDGYLSARTHLQVGNRLKGTLDISTTGTVIAGQNGRIGMGSNASPEALGTVNVAGYLQVGGFLRNGELASGILNIMSTGTVNVGGFFEQNNRSLLNAELNITRSADMVDPTLTSPVLNVAGGATLSGTLRVYGSALASVNYTGGGGGKATDLSGIPVIRAGGGITGDFDMVEIIGMTIPPDLPDYIRGGGLRVNEGGAVDTRYDVGYGLAWKSGISDAHGAFTVEDGKTFDVNIQLQDRRGITFTSGWDGMSLVKKGEGTLVLSVENSYTGTTTVESGTLRFGGPTRHTMGALVNDAVIDFGTSGTDATATQRTIRASSLAGNGTYLMSLDVGAGLSDQLIIDGDASGSHRLLIKATGTTTPTGNEPKITLVNVGGVYDMNYTDEVTLSGSTFYGSFDYGLFNYKIELQNGRIVLVNTGLDIQAFDAIKGVPGAQTLLWFDQLDNAARRFGELRSPREGRLGLDVWGRGHAATTTVGGGSSEARLSDVDIWGAEAGVDYTWKLDDQRATLGAYVGTGNASQDFKGIPHGNYPSVKATGESDLLGLGVYGAWFSDSGWFANATASLAQYKNSFDSEDFSYNHTTADYKDRGYGVSAEVGRRVAIGEKGWFVEPAVQGALARVTRANYSAARKDIYGASLASPELSVQGTDLTVNRLRGALRFGRSWQTRAGWLEIVGRIAATRESSTGGDVNIGSANRWRPNLDGTRYEAGAGVFWQVFDFGQIYADYEYSAGDNFEKPWAISLGFRLSL